MSGSSESWNRKSKSPPSELVDLLRIKSIRIEGSHGYYEEERLQKNLFELDVEIGGFLREAADSDDLTLTFNYEKVVQVAEEVLSGPSRHLIETLCMEIGDSLFREFSAASTLVVTLRKLNPPLSRPTHCAEIEMRWQR